MRTRRHWPAGLQSGLCVRQCARWHSGLPGMKVGGSGREVGGHQLLAASARRLRGSIVDSQHPPRPSTSNRSSPSGAHLQ